MGGWGPSEKEGGALFNNYSIILICKKLKLYTYVLIIYTYYEGFMVYAKATLLEVDDYSKINQNGLK